MDHVNFLKLWKLCGGENKKGMADSSESDVGLNERTKMVCGQGWLQKHGHTLFAARMLVSTQMAPMRQVPHTTMLSLSDR